MLRFEPTKRKDFKQLTGVSKSAKLGQLRGERVYCRGRDQGRSCAGSHRHWLRGCGKKFLPDRIEAHRQRCEALRDNNGASVIVAEENGIGGVLYRIMFRHATLWSRRAAEHVWEACCRGAKQNSKPFVKSTPPVSWQSHRKILLS